MRQHVPLEELLLFQTRSRGYYIVQSVTQCVCIVVTLQYVSLYTAPVILVNSVFSGLKFYSWF